MEESFSLNRLLFGSIKKKLGWAFGTLILILAVFAIITYSISSQILEDQTYIREVNVPLELMVEQVIGYDAMLTGAAHAALLHAEKGDFAEVKMHKKKYDEIGIKLDNLLKINAIALINRSRRSVEEKEKVYGYLRELDKVNIALVELEMGAFDAMEKNDTKKADSLIVSEQYHESKKQLADLYQKWANEEARIAEYYEQRILTNSRNVQIYNLYLGILFILIASIMPFIITRTIAKPIQNLYDVTKEIEKGNFKIRTNIKTGDELEELGNAFNKTTEQLEKTDEERKQIDKAKTEFLSITSHELRSPMTPMRAQLQMLMEGYFGKINKEQKESLEIVLRNTERLDKIIQDFLEISRIEAARLKFNFVKVNLTPYIKQIVDEMRGFMPEKKIEFVAEIGKLPMIEVDPDRAMQVLRNLLNNAIKFSAENGKIFINVEKQGEYITFSVKDLGMGIPKESQSRIFEPFFQAGGMYDRKVGGTGLGLAICRGIVESQNGKIWFRSQEGKGTTFYFTVPLKPVKEIAPIRLLFSPNQNIEENVKKIFIEILGPIGEKEFEDIKNKGLTSENLNAYLIDLKKKKILENIEEFKNKIGVVFGEKERKISSNELANRGFIKEKIPVKKVDSTNINKLIKSKK